ncbi:FtsK/SpoIIIE domain-containing protein [Nonomuraea dietziae]|uniref:FtsK/SpoIIIE domain-containing protein n=1 Tax=Nonomuraea dietziae TaxID=65515 RepID=UPI0033F8F631
MTTEPLPAAVPVGSLSIWDPIHLGTDENGASVHVRLAERNMFIGGEPGAGKSAALQLVVAHAAMSLDCHLILVDGKRVELGLWRDCAERFIGPSVDEAIDTLKWLQSEIDKRTDWLLSVAKRKITRDMPWPIYVLFLDEIAYFSATVGTPAQQKEFNALNRDIVARGRAPGIIPVEATQRPSADILPTSLRDLFGYRWAFRCSTEASSDTILGHGWADRGYSATSIDPQARGVGWLRAEDGIPRRIKAAYLTDEEIIYLANYAAQLRGRRHLHAVNEGLSGGEVA